MIDTDPDPFGEALAAGAFVVFVLIAGPFVLPFWAIGKLALLVERKWKAPSA